MPIEIGPADRPSRRGVAERSGMAGPASGCCNAAAPNGVEEQNAPATAPCISPRLEIANGTAIPLPPVGWRSEEHTSELKSPMRISYSVLRLKTKKVKSYEGCMRETSL